MPRRPRGQVGLTESQERDYKQALLEFQYWANVFNLCLIMNHTFIELSASRVGVLNLEDPYVCNQLFRQILIQQNERLLDRNYQPIVASNTITVTSKRFQDFLDANNVFTNLPLYNFEADNVAYLNLEANYRFNNINKVIPTLIRSKMREAAYYAVQKIEEIQPVGLRATLAAQVLCLPPTYGALLTNSTPASLSITANTDNSYIAPEGLAFFAENDWLNTMFFNERSDASTINTWLEAHTRFMTSSVMIEDYVSFLETTNFNRAYAYRLLFFMIQEARNISADALPQYRVSSLDSPYLPARAQGQNTDKRNHVYGYVRAENADLFKDILSSYGGLRDRYYGLPVFGDLYATRLNALSSDSVTEAIAQISATLAPEGARLVYIDASRPDSLLNIIREGSDFQSSTSQRSTSAMAEETVEDEQVLETDIVPDSASTTSNLSYRSSAFDQAFEFARDAGTAKVSDFFVDVNNSPYSPYYFEKELNFSNSNVRYTLNEDLKARHDLIPCGSLEGEKIYALNFSVNPNFKTTLTEISPGVNSTFATPYLFNDLQERPTIVRDGATIPAQPTALPLSAISGQNSIVKNYEDVQENLDFLYDWVDFGFFHKTDVRQYLKDAKEGNPDGSFKIGIPDFGTPIFMRPFFAKEHLGDKEQNISDVRESRGIIVGDNILRLNERERFLTSASLSEALERRDFLSHVLNLDEYVTNPFTGFMTTSGNGIASVRKTVIDTEPEMTVVSYLNDVVRKDYLTVEIGYGANLYGQYTSLLLLSNTVKKNWLYALAKHSLTASNATLGHDTGINNYLYDSGSSLYYWLRGVKSTISQMTAVNRQKIAGFIYNVLDLGNFPSGTMDNPLHNVHHLRMVNALTALTGVQVLNDYGSRSLTSTTRTARGASQLILPGFTQGGTYLACYTLLLCFYEADDIPDEILVFDATKNVGATYSSQCRQIEFANYFTQFIRNLTTCANIQKLKRNPSAFANIVSPIQYANEYSLVSTTFTDFFNHVLLKRYTAKDFFGISKVEDYTFQFESTKNILVVDSFIQDLNTCNFQMDTMAGIYVWNQALMLMKEMRLTRLSFQNNPVPLPDWVLNKIKNIYFEESLGRMYLNTTDDGFARQEQDQNTVLSNLNDLSIAITWVAVQQVLNNRYVPNSNDSNREGVFAFDTANLNKRIYWSTEGTYQRKYVATPNNETLYAPYFAGVLENIEAFTEEVNRSITNAPQLAEIYERVANEPLTTSIGTEYEVTHPRIDGVSGAIRAFTDAGWTVLRDETAQSMNEIKIVLDPSVFNWVQGNKSGVEIVPGPQIGEAAIEYNALVIKQLLSLGFQTHYSAGLHIHIQTRASRPGQTGPNILTVEQKKNLLYNVGAMEPFFMECTIPEYRKASSQVWGRSVFKKIQPRLAEFNRITTDVGIQQFIGMDYTDRYHFINVKAETLQPTYEFRFPTSNFDINYVEHMIRTLSKIYEFSKVARVPARGKIDYEKLFGTAIYTYWMNNALTYARTSELGYSPDRNVNLPWRFDDEKMRNEY